LFTGAGGGLLGSHLLGWRPVGYVEIDEYCQRIIAQRITDGLLPEAPIFCDIKTFNGQGYAASYKGVVDVITAGFLCQPFSVAGKRDGEHDARNLWPATVQTLRTIRPRHAYLENVPGLLSAGQRLTLIIIQKVRQLDIFGAADCESGAGRIVRHVLEVAGLRYFGRVLGDLAESGYDAKRGVLGADDVGANHKRKRLWIWATRRDD
jgi:DNA (cytosine-5)-methyltransferase 1